jgi:electron transport complex protein RnfC
VQDYNLFDCIECGCCAVVCPSHIPLVQYYRFAKTESWAREREKRAAEHARERHAAREARLERLERERQARLRKKKEAVAGQGRRRSGLQEGRHRGRPRARRGSAAARSAPASSPPEARRRSLRSGRREPVMQAVSD